MGQFNSQPMTVMKECIDIIHMGTWWRAYEGHLTYVALFPLDASEAQVRACLGKSLDAEIESPLFMQDLMTVN